MRALWAVVLLAGPAAATPAGDPAPDFTLPDLEGRPVELRSFRDRKAVVLLFLGIECPRSRAAEPRLADLAASYGPRGVAFLAINSNWNESAREIAEHVRRAAFPIPVLKDEDGRVADLYKVGIQPAAVVIDAAGTIRYRGLIDDHKNEEFVRRRYLKDAIEAILSGAEVAMPVTEPEGCVVRRREKARSAEVTYARDVAPILFRNCVSCHRPGQVGPFSLETYEQAAAWSAEIVREVKRGRMPPWKPVSNRGAYYNERRLTDAEVAILEKWHRAGAPEGNPAEAPPRPEFSDRWMLGKPDAVLKAEGGFVLGPRGRDEYRCYVLENPFDEDKWVVGVEFRPGNPRAVHHIIGYLDMTEQAVRKDRADPEPGYRSNGSGPNIVPSGSLSGWAPGNMPRRLPPGVGRRLRKGERIVLETHYHRTGRPEKDEGAEVALYFAREPVQKMLHVHMLANVFLRIPPGAKDHKVTATYTVPLDVTAYDVMPHMHLLGRRIAVTATFPNGEVRDLVRIEDWDFAWQETYQFKEPWRLPKGTQLRLEAFYDNSAENRNNPSDPPRWVKWGEQTTDEMCIAFIHYTFDGEDRRRVRTVEERKDP
jgi:peroxiredoxin/mono/diheme cytochrome c family protein